MDCRTSKNIPLIIQDQKVMSSDANGRYRTSAAEDGDDDTVALTLGYGDGSITSPGSTSGKSSVVNPEDELHDGCIVLGSDASRGNR